MKDPSKDKARLVVVQSIADSWATGVESGDLDKYGLLTEFRNAGVPENLIEELKAAQSPREEKPVMEKIMAHINPPSA